MHPHLAGNMGDHHMPVVQFYPEHGIGKYKIPCHCRKPETGMFEMAEQDFEVDKASSWMIGDKLIDIEAGRNYGVRTVLVGTGYGAGVHDEQKKKGDFPYDLYADDLLEAYDEINRETAGNL